MVDLRRILRGSRGQIAHPTGDAKWAVQKVQSKPNANFQWLWGAVLLAGLSAPASAENEKDCIEILSHPPFVDILFRNDGRDFSHISTSRLGSKLLGVPCKLEHLDAYFSDSGWEGGFWEKKAWEAPTKPTLWLCTAALDPLHGDGYFGGAMPVRMFTFSKVE